ncbi:PAS domain S-box protein [Candidatus Nitrospira bockiana]
MLRILHLEDNDQDAELITSKLATEGLTCEIVRVQTREEFLAKLSQREPHLILADYTLPAFDGLSALNLVRARDPDIPFIFVSGTIGEESAVVTLHCGATDYVVKGRLSRLAPAVRRALREAEQRAERRRADEALRISEERFRLVARATNDAVWDWDLKAGVIWWNDTFYSLFGYRPEDLEPGVESWIRRLHPEDLDRIEHSVDRLLEERRERWAGQYRFRRADGSYALVFGRAYALYDASGAPIRLIGGMTDITELTRAQEERNQLAHHVHLLLQSTGEGIFGLDVSGNVTFANKAAETMLGYSLAELIGRNAHSLLHHSRFDGRVYPEDECPVTKACTAGQHGRVEEDVLWTRDGRSLPVAYSAYPIVEEGVHKGAVVVFQDITERKRAEQALKDSEARTRAVLESALDAVIGMDEAGIITDWNGNAEVMFGWSRREAGGKKLADLIIPPRYREAHLRGLKRFLMTGHGPLLRKRVELTALRRDGTEFPIEVSVSPLVVGDRYVFSAFIADITERKLAETRIREQAALIDLVRDGIFVTDLDDRILFWNKGAERVYEWAAEDALGQKSEALYREASAVLTGAREQCLRTGEWAGELKQCTKSGKELIVQSRWTIVRAEDGSPTSILQVNTDVTETKLLEKQYLQAQRLENLGMLAGGIAHDLNNVMTPILIGVQLLRLNETNEQTIKFAEAVETSARRGAQMIKQILSFSRGVEGDRAPVSLKHLLGELETIIVETFPRSIQVRVDVPDDLWTIIGNSTQLYQLLLNLCVNARDAMPSGGGLRITAENVRLDEHYARMEKDARPGPYVALSVVDTGTGIPPHLIDKIFNPFFTTKEVGRGTGLGLSTVLGIAKNHGGFVKVYSERGKGTAMKVYLPAEAAAAAAATAGPEKALPQGCGERILVVDDELTILEMVKATLETYGYRVWTAQDGTEALAVYARHLGQVNLVITDVMMPFMDGAATIRALQRLDPGVKVIAVSGLTMNERVMEAASAGPVSFLQKPYTTEALLNTVHGMLTGRPGEPGAFT